MRTRVALSVLCISLSAASAQAQTVWYVDDDGDTENGCTSWEDACPELQTALSLATDGDQVWVAVGTYKPDYDISTGQHNGDREATFQLFTGVEIYGGFDGTESSLEGRAGLFDQTILTGDLNGDDAPQFENYAENSLHTVTIPQQAHNAIVDGFTITGGNARDFDPVDERGGGMLCKGSSSVVRYCRFINNIATLRGGGLENTGQATTVMNCYFGGNVSETSGGGMYNSGWETTVTGCTFIDNVAETVAGGGLYEMGTLGTVSRCKFIANMAFVGGGYFCGGCAPEIVDCVFKSNTSNLAGGGARIISGSATLTNCVFSENVAFATGGAAYVEGNIVFSNTILWGNGAFHGDGISTANDTTVTVSYSVVESGLDSFEFGKNAELIWGPGNIEEDPLFVDVDGPDDNPGTEDDDLRLSPGSPCIDAADNTAVPKGVVMDLDGNPRFVDDPDAKDTGLGECPIVDMGAQEYQEGTTACCPADFDGDGFVNAADLAELLGSWGQCADCDDCPADFTDDCGVNAADLAQLLGNWGPCP